MVSPFRRALPARAPHELMHSAMLRGDAAAVRQLLTQHPEFRPLINAPLFDYNAPAIVACANSAPMVDVLLEFGADPNKRSDWWAGTYGANNSLSAVNTAACVLGLSVPRRFVKRCISTTRI